VKLCFPFFIIVFSVLGFAVLACIGSDRELSVFPCFLRFRVFFFTIRTFRHGVHIFIFDD